jgi:hypothetical protein
VSKDLIDCLGFLGVVQCKDFLGVVQNIFQMKKVQNNDK